MRREKNFDLYIINDVYKNDDIIYKFTVDSKFNLFVYNNPYNKKTVNLLDKNGNKFTVKIVNKQLEGFKITKITQINEYKKYDAEVDNILKNKLYHFFGNL